MPETELFVLNMVSTQHHLKCCSLLVATGTKREQCFLVQLIGTLISDQDLKSDARRYHSY